MWECKRVYPPLVSGDVDILEHFNRSYWKVTNQQAGIWPTFYYISIGKSL